MTAHTFFSDSLNGGRTCVYDADGKRQWMNAIDIYNAGLAALNLREMPCLEDTGTISISHLSEDEQIEWMLQGRPEGWTQEDEDWIDLVQSLNDGKDGGA